MAMALEAIELDSFWGIANLEFNLTLSCLHSFHHFMVNSKKAMAGKQLWRWLWKLSNWIAFGNYQL